MWTAIELDGEPMGGVVEIRATDEATIHVMQRDLHRRAREPSLDKHQTQPRLHW